MLDDRCAAKIRLVQSAELFSAVRNKKQAELGKGRCVVPNAMEAAVSPCAYRRHRGKLPAGVFSTINKSLGLWRKGTAAPPGTPEFSSLRALNPSAWCARVMIRERKTGAQHLAQVLGRRAEHLAYALPPPSNGLVRLAREGQGFNLLIGAT
ncbi:hypothetical protein ACFOD4_10685 [Pseudoroseomonas globiformis]|uniref:Transposase n=1 Tax=Teichococcus globiformis TaxID=2307229 RepID=A0ABV7G1S4_9PROT